MLLVVVVYEIASAIYSSDFSNEKKLLDSLRFMRKDIEPIWLIAVLAQAPVTGCSVLSLAITKGLEQVTSFIINLGVNLENRDSLGNTPLHLSVFHGHTNMSLQLINKGAKMDSVKYDERCVINFRAMINLAA